jgi:murein DD-endopeptidase MepM/ murein hydrolase activator NlpD
MMAKQNSFTTLFLLFLFTFASSISLTMAQNTDVANQDTLTQTVLIHPVIETDSGELIFSREHNYNKHLKLGDQLARDFTVAGATDDGIIEFYAGDGKENKDYLAWRKNVFAPVTGTVTLVNHPDTTNKPGSMNRDAEPGRVYIKRDDGVTVSLVHVREIEVTEGQKVAAGNVVAKVGNNGNSTGPHTHVGAWKNNTPLQIQIDLYAEERN